MTGGRAGRSEVPLEGGTANRGLVVRVGDTVRRPQTSASPGIHAVLAHLERVGFEGAPRFLGVDDEGREIVSYLAGEVPVAPHPEWALTEEALISVGDLLRRYHEAVRSFDPAPYTWYTTVPSRYGRALVSHNDPNLDNVVFRDGVAVALIDFDLASPGSALWDVALAARLWVPLRDPSETPASVAGRELTRLRLIAEAYGLCREDRERLAAAARATHTWCYDIIRRGAREGHAGYAHHWTPPVRAHAARGQRWLDANESRLSEAVSGAPGPR